MSERNSDGEWLTLIEAGARLGLKPDAVRKQIRQGRRHGRKGNTGKWLAFVAADEAGRPRTVRADDPDPRDTLVEALREQVADLRAERDRLLGIIEGLTPRRRWWWWR